MSKMKALVLAAGYGQRLRPITEKLPKALVPIGGRAMIEYPLLLLRHHGIKEIVINLHHLGEMIEEYLEDGKKLGLQIIYSKEKKLLDTGGGILQARSYLESSPFIVINSDVIIDLPLNDLINHHYRNKATATLVLRTDARADLYGPIETSRDLKIQKFLGHQALQEGPAGNLTKFMFTGVQIVEPTIFDYMDGEKPFSLTKVTYPKMLLQGEPLYGFAFEGYWQDLGTAERIQETETKLASGKVKLHFLD